MSISIWSKILNKCPGFHYIILFLLFICLHNYSSAQPRKSRSQLAYGGCFTLGVSFLNVEPLNEDFERNGYATIAPEKMYFGGLGYVIYNKFIISADGGFVTRGAEFPSSQVKYRNSTYFFNIGYSLLSELKGVGFPFIGIGMGSSKFELISNTNELPYFYRKDRTNDTDYEFNSLLLQVGYTFLRMGDYMRAREKKKGIMFGLQGGFIMTLGDKQWNINGIKSDSPRATFNGIYIKVMVGGWGGRIFGS